MEFDDLTFEVAPRDDPDSPQAITPRINGESLVDLVSEFEAAAKYKPVGGYGGLVPNYFTFALLHAYYLGEDTERWPSPGMAWLLDCGCGVSGCWPLAVQVTATTNQVSWSGFSQPHRPQWDYSPFGPFAFERLEYDLAIAELAELLSE